MSKVDEEGASFRIDDPTLEDGVCIERLLQFATRNDLQSPNDFSLVVSLTDEILTTLYQVFESFAARKIHCTSLKIFAWDACVFDPKLFESVMRIVNEASMFETINLSIDWHGSIGRLDTMRMLPSLQENHRLKELELSSTMDYSPADIQSLSRTLQETTTLTNLQITFANEHHEPFWEALARNKTLESIDLNNVQREHAVLEISQALAGHEKLKRLNLKCTTGTDSEYAVAIHMLMVAEKCRLESLLIAYTGPEKFHLNTECLMKALKQNRSLKQFATANELSGERPFSTLLGAVQLHPALEVIVLSQRFVPKDMEAASKLKILPRRVQFGNLQFLKYIYSEPDPMKAFLDSHPEVLYPSHATIPCFQNK